MLAKEKMSGFHSSRKLHFSFLKKGGVGEKTIFSKNKMAENQKRFRTKQKKVRLTEEENELLKRKINVSPYDNFQNYARHMLLTGEIHYVDYSELKELKWEINKIGNNINQIAKLANQFDEISQEDIEELLEIIQQVEILVTDKLKKEQVIKKSKIKK